MNERFWSLWSDSHVENLARWKRLAIPAIPPSGRGWTSTWTANPDFLRLNDELILYYRGTGAADGDPEERDQIGGALVRSVGPHGIELEHWTDKPLLPSGGPDAFDADNLDPAAILFGGEVLLFYSALGPGPDSIGLATSPDGRTFIKSGPIMEGRAPTVVARKGRLYLLNQHMVGDGYGLSLYGSIDGRNFTPAARQPVFVPEAGSWDSLSVVTARLYDGGDYVYMIYGGSADTVDEPAYFGLARSRDLVHWERHPGNPIFGAGARGTPDGGCIWFPALAETDQGFAMLYEGSRGTPRWDLDCSICLASVS